MEQRLESFLTLCDTMHYGRAAEKLHLSQPAVSKHIQSLENQYGVSLFTYANRRLQKTREGEILQQYVQTLRYNEEKLMEKLCQQSTRLLRIGATKSIGEYVLLPNIKRFLSFPEHEIEFLVDNTERLLERLDHSELDFVVLEGIFHKQHYDWILFRNEPYIGICAKNHPFAGREVQLDEKKYMDPDTYKTYLGSFGARSFDDILYFIGKKSLPAMNLLDRVVPKKSGFFDSISKMLQRNNQVNEKQQSSRNNSGVVVKGLDGLRIQLSKCCNPIPGDDIMGFVSQGQGIKVHRRDCPNIQQPEIKARLIDVYWDFASISTMKFQADLEIVGLDRPNLLNDVVTSLGQMKINILNIHADVVDMKAIIKLKISVEDASRLQQAIDNIDRIQGIYEIKRVIH